MDANKKIGAQLLIGIGTVLIVFPLLLLFGFPSLSNQIGDGFLLFGLILSPIGMLCVIIGEIFAWKRIRDVRLSGTTDTIGSLKIFAVIGIIAIAVYVLPQAFSSIRSERELGEYWRQQRESDPNFCDVPYSKERGIDWSATQQVVKNKKMAGCTDVRYVLIERATSTDVVASSSVQSTNDVILYSEHAAFQVEAEGSYMIKIHDISVPGPTLIRITLQEDGTELATARVEKSEMSFNLTDLVMMGHEVVVTFTENHTGTYEFDPQKDKTLLDENGLPVSKVVAVF